MSLFLRGSSRSSRNKDIQEFGKALASPEQWESAWQAAGGTEGLSDVFLNISVTEVKALSRAIGFCNRGRKVIAREKAIDELLHALLPSHYSGSKVRNHDQRPIWDHYAHMVRACSPEFVGQLLHAKDLSNPLYRKLPLRWVMHKHHELLQTHIIEGIFGGGYVDDHVLQYLEPFLYTQPSRPSPDPKVSASMAFSARVLKLRLEDIDNDKSWPSHISEADILFSLLRRSIRRRLPEAKLRDIIMLGMHLLEAKPKLQLTFQSRRMWHTLVTRWKRAPELYKDVVMLALRLGLGGSQKSIGRNFFEISRAMKAKPELRWPLLHMYCLYVPKQGLDLEKVDDFEPLANQPWPIEMFFQLSKDQAVRLLTGLYDANPEYNFLHGPTGITGISILSNVDITPQKNFNVRLLLTLLQRSSTEIQKRAEHAVDDLRKKAATASQQSDRAKLAKAASAHAIASGSLDLYGETVTWQQRYLRDPLTSKTIFGRDAVMTQEGIDLLSGIPEPFPEDMTLAELASRVEKSNGIIRTFHESMSLAKREPSFHKPDWASVTSLFGAVINCRLDRMKDIPERLLGHETDVYNSIWSDTLAMLDTLSVDFLKTAYAPVQKLFRTLSSTALVTTTKAMLEAGNKNRRKQNRQPEDDTLERLSYDALLQLAQGDNPELAQELILQTILDRPDASSWHRQLLSISFMNRLTAKDAHRMLFAFATAIGEKLEEQSYVKVGEAQPLPSAPPQSVVKVTTVKNLAKLLDKAGFVSADAAVEVLVELFKAGTHRDIRLATLESLLSLLNTLCSEPDANWRSNALIEKIMEALVTIIPVVGSVDERRPPREQDWEEARKTGALPNTSDTSAGLPPLLSAILTAPYSPQYSGLKKLKAEFAERIILPVLWHSQAEHQRWAILFLAKSKVNINADNLSSAPITTQVWDILLGKYPEFIPQKVLDDFNKHIVMTIAPPAALKDFNKSVRANADICKTPEAQRWLSIFDQSIERYSSSGTKILVRMMTRHYWPLSSLPNGMALNKVLDIVIGHASLFLSDYENYTDVWDDFVHDLRHPAKLTQPRADAESIRSMNSRWQKTGRVVLEKVTALVIEEKKKSTQGHKFRILPSARKLCLWLLPYPCFPDATEVDYECKNFAEEMERLLKTFLTGEGDVLRWSKIAEDTTTVSMLLNTAEERLRVALYIGKLSISLDGTEDQRASALNLVRIALSMKLIEDGREGLNSIKSASSEDLVQRLKAMTMEWQRHSDEDIRENVMNWKRRRMIFGTI